MAANIILMKFIYCLLIWKPVNHTKWKRQSTTYKNRKIYKNISEETQIERDLTNKRAKKIALKWINKNRSIVKGDYTNCDLQF